MFLFTTTEKVLAQFLLSIDIFDREREFEEYVRIVPARVSSAKHPRFVKAKIEELKVGMKHVNLEARVVEIPKPKMVYTKWSQRPGYVSNVLIADKTGTIRISLWNENINKVSEGDLIKIEDFKVSSFNGAPQLRMGRTGKISVLDHRDE